MDIVPSWSLLKHQQPQQRCWARDEQPSTEPENCQGGGVGARDELYCHDPGPPRPPPSPPTPHTHQPELFSLDDEEPGGSRPDRLFVVSRPQDRVQRRTVQQIADIALLPTLDDLPDVLRFFRALSSDPEQVIEVPKILPEDVFLRTAVREPQLAEQLVEVPTIVSYSWLQVGMEQNVDIPVHGRGGESLVFKVFFPDRVQQRCLVPRNAFLSGLWSRTLISPLVKASKIFSQDRVHPLLRTFQLVFLKLWMSLVKGFSALFPKLKKCQVGFAPAVGTAPRVEPIHAGSSCGSMGRWRRRLDPHSLCARALLEEVAVRPRSVAPAVGPALTAAR